MQNNGTLVISSIRPNDSLDTYAVALANEIQGGLHSYSSFADLTSIPFDRLSVGMIVSITNDTDTNKNGYYVLNKDYQWNYLYDRYFLNIELNNINFSYVANIILKSPYSFIIDKVTAKTDYGSCNLILKVNRVNCVDFTNLNVNKNKTSYDSQPTEYYDSNYIDIGSSLDAYFINVNEIGKLNLQIELIRVSPIEYGFNDQINEYLTYVDNYVRTQSDYIFLEEVINFSLNNLKTFELDTITKSTFVNATKSYSTPLSKPGVFLQSSRDGLLNEILEGTNNSNSVDFTFNRSFVESSPLTVNFNIGGSAVYNSDYTQTGADTFGITNGTITIPSNNTSAVLTINTLGDYSYEDNESLSVTLASSSSYDILTNNSRNILILNDDPNPSITLALDKSNDFEGDVSPGTSAIYTFTRSVNTPEPLTVYFSVTGSATYEVDYTQSGAIDYTTTTGSIIIPANQTSASLTITSVPDTNPESNETVILTILSNSYYTVGTNSGVTYTITNDDIIANISLNVTPSTINEGNSTSNSATFSFVRNIASLYPLTVYFSITGSAIYSTDYTQTGSATYDGTNGSVVIPANQTTTSITINSIPNIFLDSDKTLTYTLTTHSTYSITTTNPVTLSILNDDSPPNISLSLSPTTILEGDTLSNSAVYTFSRSYTTDQPLTVNFNVGGTAVFNTDYNQSGANTFNGLTGSVIIPANQASTNLTINSIPDTTIESTTSLILTLIDETNYNLTTTTPVQLTINTDDAVPNISLSLTPTSILEGNTSSNAAVYTFTRSFATNQPLTVDFVVGGTANLTTDYTQSGASTFTSTTGSIIIPANQTSADLTITSVFDTVNESDETLSITLANTSIYYNLTTINPVTLTITNDDFIPNISLSLTPTSILEGNTTSNSAIYTFTRSFSTNQPLTVFFSVGGTASLTTDYTQSGANTFTSTTGSIIIPANQTSADLTITSVFDTVNESDETLSITLTADSNYGITTSSTVSLTLTNDDAAPLLLDNITTSTVFSFRRLRSSYSGHCIRVRRSSDSTLLDIGFVNNLLDTTTLLNFVGAGDGIITIWYDQSGNSRNMISNTNTLIVESGSLQVRNSKPSVKQSINDYFNLNLTTVFATNNPTLWTVNYVAGMQNSGTFQRILSTDINNNWLFGYWGGNQQAAFFGSVGSFDTGLPVDSNLQLYTAIGQGGSDALVYRNTQSFVANAPSVSPKINNSSVLQTNGISWPGEGSDCYFSELIIVDGSIDNTQRNTIESDQVTYFGLNTNVIVPLVYSSPTDTTDLFYYRGTDSLVNSWSNPATTSKINLLTNFSDPGSDLISSLVDQANSSNGFYTSNTDNAWVAIDVLNTPSRFVISGYMLQNRDNADAQAIRRWKFQGASSVSAWTTTGVNSAAWVDLATYNNVTLLSNTAGASFLFTLPLVTKSYRYYRILHTGLNSSNLNYLVLGEIKFYGNSCT